MSAHTPGPWEVVADAGQSVSPRDGYLVRWVDGLGVECDVAWVRPGLMLGAGEVRANANLIASAPDLLESLSGLLGNLNGYEHHPDLCSRTMECDDKDEDGCSYCGNDACPVCECGLAETQAAMDKARAAIAKATGGDR